MQMLLGDISTLEETESNSHLLQIFDLNNSNPHFLPFDLVYCSSSLLYLTASVYVTGTIACISLGHPTKEMHKHKILISV